MPPEDGRGCVTGHWKRSSDLLFIDAALNCHGTSGGLRRLISLPLEKKNLLGILEKIK